MHHKDWQLDTQALGCKSDSWVLSTDHLRLLFAVCCKFCKLVTQDHFACDVAGRLDFMQKSGYMNPQRVILIPDRQYLKEAVSYFENPQQQCCSQQQVVERQRARKEKKIVSAVISQPWTVSHNTNAVSTPELLLRSGWTKAGRRCEWDQRCRSAPHPNSIFLCIYYYDILIQPSELMVTFMVLTHFLSSQQWAQALIQWTSWTNGNLNLAQFNSSSIQSQFSQLLRKQVSNPWSLKCAWNSATISIALQSPCAFYDL